MGQKPVKFTEKQERFITAMVAHGQQERAYRESYDCENMTPGSIAGSASKLANQPKIAKEIARRKGTLGKDLLPDDPEHPDFDARQALKMWLAIFRADPNELASVRVGACRYCYGEGHRYQWREREFREAMEKAEAQAEKVPGTPLPDIAGGFGYRWNRKPHPDCPECEGLGETRLLLKDTTRLSPTARLLYGGAKQTRHGIEIIFADKMKALEAASRIVGAFNDKLNVTMNGAIDTMAAVVQMQAADPQEAARIYQEMIAGIAAK